MASPPDGSNVTSNGKTPYTQEEIDRLTGTGARLGVSDLDYEDRLAFFLRTLTLDEFLDDGPLDTFAFFRKIRKHWVRICARYKRLGGDSHLLTMAVENVLDTEVQARPPGGRALLIPATAVQPEDLTYLWEPYLPCRMVSILDGDPDVGKTGLACLFAASVSQGYSMPDAFGKMIQRPDGPGHVLMVAMEDLLGGVIIPRLTRCGADLTRIAGVFARPPSCRARHERGWTNRLSRG